VDERSVVMLLITDSKAVRNHVIHMDNPPSAGILGELSLVLSNCLNGRSLEHIHMDAVSELLGETTVDREILMPILSAIVKTIESEDKMQVHTSGVKNILGFPEFSDLEKAKSLFQALEEKNVLITLLDHDGSENVKVVIGAENTLEQMKDCSIIKAHYALLDQTVGSIGIIGPTRMHYAQVISILNGITKYVNTVLKALTGS